MERRLPPKRKSRENTKSGPVKEMDQQKDKFFPRPFLKTEPITVIVPIKTEPGTLVKRADEEDCESDDSDKSALQSDGELFSVFQVTLFSDFPYSNNPHPAPSSRFFASVDVSNMKRLDLVNNQSELVI